jgi:hypothetical protein
LDLIWINPKEKEKPHYSLRSRCSPQLQCPHGLGPSLQPLTGPYSQAQLARAWCAVTKHCRGQSDTMMSSPPTQRRRRSQINRGKMVQSLHVARFEYFEQLSPLGWLQILNRINVINSWAEINLNLPWISKGFKPCGKNLVNSLKFYLNMVFTKVNLVRQLVCKIWSSNTSVNMNWVKNKKWVWIEIQTMLLL